MTAADLFWQRVHRRALDLTPEQARTFLKAVDTLKAEFTGREVETLIAQNDIEGVVRLALSDQNLARAFADFRARMQLTTRDAVAYFGKDIPGVRPVGVSILFDTVNPDVIEAVKKLDSQVMNTLSTDIRQTVRQAIIQGIEAGAGPRTTARALRDVLGLAPNQLDAVENFRKALEGDPDAGSPLTRALRDRRFDATVERGGLSSDQVDTMTAAYQRRMVAFNAETNARTATLDSLKLGQQLSWQDAMDKGVIPEGYVLMKQWKGVMDDRERDEHIDMEGETVPFDDFYSNGEMIPGESTYNCRCLSIVFAQAA